MDEFYLHPGQVRDLIKQAEGDDEVIVIRCVRKGPASKMNGPDQGELYDLHCTKKPPYTPKTGRDRSSEDSNNGVLTVWVTNRRSANGDHGAWRRVNIEQVRKVIYRGHEYEVSSH